MLCEKEIVKYPGFIETSESASVILTYSPTNQLYKVWSLANYKYLYKIIDENSLKDIKISNDTLLLSYQRPKEKLDLQIIEAVTGDEVTTINLPISIEDLEFYELMHKVLLLKCRNKNLKIHNISNATVVEVKDTLMLDASDLFLLIQRNLFIIHCENKFIVRNFAGEIINEFEGYWMYKEIEPTGNSIVSTKKFDFLISYRTDSKGTGSLAIIDISTGKELWKLTSTDASSNTYRALENISALLFDHETNELYLGNDRGKVYIWQ